MLYFATANNEKDTVN